MSTFVLIHGAWHGGWVWDRVATQLKQRGHSVFAPDLPGHGSNRTPAQQITLQSYTDSILCLIDACAEPVILAGHSMGGIVISQVAEQRPERIAALVYVCAFLLGDGQTLLDVAQNDKKALVMPNVILSPDGASATLRAEILRQAFYADCSDQDYEFAKSRMVPQPTAPFGTRLRLSGVNFGSVPRFYVECLQDRAITVACQRQMQARVGCNQVFTLDCGHSPFFSSTGDLAKCLMSAAALVRAATEPARERAAQ
jgi:pimeloyl-ACP methyl ester carboxylesterase